MKEFELSQKCWPFLGETDTAELGKAEVWEMQMLQGEVQRGRTPGCGEEIEGWIYFASENQEKMLMYLKWTVASGHFSVQKCACGWGRAGARKIFVCLFLFAWVFLCSLERPQLEQGWRQAASPPCPGSWCLSQGRAICKYKEMFSFLRVVSVQRVWLMLQSILLEGRGWEGTRGFPKRNRKWTCREASGAMEKKKFLLECYRGTVLVILQLKKPPRESLQASTFSAATVESGDICFFNSLLENKHPLVFVPSGACSIWRKGTSTCWICPPWGSLSVGVGKWEQKEKK